MLMVPLQFLPATALAALAVWLAARQSETIRVRWLAVFLCAVSVQLFLLGLRYGYGVTGVLAIQHLTGAIIPPLAFLAFANPPASIRTVVHVLPVAVIYVAVRSVPDLADAVLAAITYGYAAATGMLAIARRGLLSSAPLRFGRALRVGIWATVALLVVSGTTDAVVAVDAVMTGGAHTPAIAGTALIVGLAALAAGFFHLVRSGRRRLAVEDGSEDAALIERLSAELNRNDLFRDPDLALSRLSKRLRVPARQISQAVNRQTHANISQFVNNRRIDAVCEALSTSDVSITRAMLDAGFLTKSNFNREFRRVTGAAPSAWRSANRDRSPAADS